MRLIALVLLICVSACQTVPQPIAIGTAPPLPAVQVPVFRPCPDPALIEAVPPSSMPSPSAGIAELANGAAADALRYRELAKRQNDILKACAKGSTQ